jgi:hypothetical protein
VVSGGNDSLPTAVHTAQERDLKPLAEESAEALDFDSRQAAEMASFLRSAWFLGVRTGHKVMVETKLGKEGDPADVVATMKHELRDLMERLGDALNTTVSATIQAWSFLGQAWIAGAKFWEIEIAARLIEASGGGFGEMLRRLDN